MDTTMQFNVTIGSTLGDNVFSTTSNDMECDGKIISRGDKFITYLTHMDAHRHLCNFHSIAVNSTIDKYYRINSSWNGVTQECFQRCTDGYCSCNPFMKDEEYTITAGNMAWRLICYQHNQYKYNMYL